MGNLVRLYRMTGQEHLATRSDELIRAFSAEVGKNSMVYPLVLSALDFYFGPSQEIVLSGEDPKAMLEVIRKPFLPNKVVLHRTVENAELLSGLAPYTETQTSLEGKVTAYVCEGFACQLPTTELSELKKNMGLSN